MRRWSLLWLAFLSLFRLSFASASSSSAAVARGRIPQASSLIFHRGRRQTATWSTLEANARFAWWILVWAARCLCFLARRSMYSIRCAWDSGLRSKTPALFVGGRFRWPAKQEKARPRRTSRNVQLRSDCWKICVADALWRIKYYGWDFCKSFDVIILNTSIWNTFWWTK